MTLRIAFIGCVKLSYAVLERLSERSDIEIVAIVTRRQSPLNTDFMSLEPIASRICAPLLLVDGNDQTSIANFLRPLMPGLIVCVGWSYLLAPELLALAPKGVLGYHPAALPRNRGRHPLIWALALGLHETGSTFFFMDEGADSGPIANQCLIPITPDDDAATLYAKMTETALSQLDTLFPALVAETLVPLPQNEALANIWRKRGRADGRIDWRMTAAAIKNLVRALSRPYPGAHCETGGKDVLIWRVALGPEASANVEPGRVLAVNRSEILVKCLDGSVWLTEHEFDPLPTLNTYL